MWVHVGFLGALSAQNVQSVSCFLQQLINASPNSGYQDPMDPKHGLRILQKPHQFHTLTFTDGNQNQKRDDKVLKYL